MRLQLFPCEFTRFLVDRLIDAINIIDLLKDFGSFSLFFCKYKIVPHKSPAKNLRSRLRWPTASWKNGSLGWNWRKLNTGAPVQSVIARERRSSTVSVSSFGGV